MYLHYKASSRGLSILCCYPKNYSVYNHENTIIISLVIVNLFRKKTEDNFMPGFGSYSDPN